MKRLRFLTIGMMTWLFFFYNIERFNGAVNFTDAAYVFVAIVAVGVTWLHKVTKVPFWGMVAGAFPLFVLTKILLRFGVLGNALPLTILESCAVVFTMTLAYWTSGSISEFEQAIANIMTGQPDLSIKSFVMGQAEMYRELNRARAHRRPLAVLSIGVDQASNTVALDKMVIEAQLTMMREYMMSEVARVLCDKLEDYNIIARNHDHFVALLPEVAPEQVELLSTQLRQVIFQQTGMHLHMGVASFPKDGTTFEKLVNEAVAHMHTRSVQQTEQAIQSKTLAEKRLA